MNPPPLPVRKRFAWIPYWIVLVLIVLVAFAPIGSVITCGWIANAHGCKVDEGSVHPCIINGKDYGQLLYTLGVLGWLISRFGWSFSFFIGQAGGGALDPVSQIPAGLRKGSRQ